MAVYSHSKISTFEQCPLKYKFRYVEKIIVVERSIESFLGEVVHSALEWIYTCVRKKIIPSLDDVISYYDSEWNREYNRVIISINYGRTPDLYYNKGIKFLIDYYTEHRPFDDNTLEVEKEIFVNLDKGGRYKIRGFIDRLSYDLNKKEYVIHDYKTSDSAPTPEKIEGDRQLSLYSIAIKELFGKDKEVLLTWHFLAFKRRVYSRRTNEQLEALKEQVIGIIDKIETTENFFPRTSKLCDWCEYRRMCPAWGNPPPHSGKEVQKEINDFEKAEEQRENGI